MNRPGVAPQTLRGLPSGFQNQQQIPQNRSVSSRLPPSGKMASNGTTWPFGGGGPMGSAGLGNPRPSNGHMATFAQIGGSQTATPLDPSEFPSLSNNQPQPSQSAWTAAGTRGFGPASNMRLQQQSALSQQQLSAQQQTQQQQDDLFSSSSQLPSSQGGFRFGNQNAVGQTSQPSSGDDFPPLGRIANGEMGQDRVDTLLRDIGFGTATPGIGIGSVNSVPSNRSNGLLNALSSTRAPGNRVASPTGLSAVSNSRSPIELNRPNLGGLADNDTNSITGSQFSSGATIRPQRDDNSVLLNMSRTDRPSQQDEPSDQRNLDSASRSIPEEAGPEVQDPLSGMNEIDKWGLRGFSYMMNNFPDYAMLVTGTDIANLGFDLASTENISNQVYSLWDDEPPAPAIPRYALPECYTVGNVAPLESKISNFNDEALIFMFYSNPGDVQQQMAAQELHNRNWRYHKTLQTWLTKDETMLPQSLGNGTERGYYIFFDIKQWQRERREFTLIYDDLETVPALMPRSAI